MPNNIDQLKQKYASVFSMIEQQGIRLSHVNMQDDKLYIAGTAPSEDAKNKIWDQIKLVDSGYKDLTVDITAEAGAASSSGGGGAKAQGASGGQSYTVQAGDSLSKISQHFYGNANQYMKIFDANKDKLSDPNKVQPGQTLTIPA